MQAHVFWVAGPWPGRLGILLRPRGGDWLGDEASAWREAGIDMVVSLLEPEEPTNASVDFAHEPARHHADQFLEVGFIDCRDL